MDTEFAFLKELERDLAEAARVERRRLMEKAMTRRSHRRAWIGAVASLLVIAFAIGFLAQGGGFGSSSMSSAAGSFSTVGSAVDGQGGDQSKRGVNEAPDVPGPQPAPADFRPRSDRRVGLGGGFQSAPRSSCQ